MKNPDKNFPSNNETTEKSHPGTKPSMHGFRCPTPEEKGKMLTSPSRIIRELARKAEF